MLSLSWLFVAAMAHMCHSSRGFECWDSSICANLSNKQRILECIQVCVSEMQNQSPHITDTNALSAEDQSLKSVRLDSRSSERRSYSMEHFRWGKPSGRKRRPIKVFSSSLEGGGSTEGAFALQPRRRQLMALEKRNKDAQRAQRSKAAYTAYSAQERKDGTYRMSHFRWGSPPAAKRNASLLKPWQEPQEPQEPQSPLTKLIRNLMGKEERMEA